MQQKIDLLTYKKGQVWMLNDKWTKDERDMQITIGDRPVLIMNDINIRGKFVTVIPFSSSKSNKSGVKCYLELTHSSTALVQEIKPVPVTNLTVFLGTITDNLMNEIDLALKIYLGMHHDPELENKYFIHSIDKCSNIYEKINNNSNITQETNTDINIVKEGDTKPKTKHSKQGFNINSLTDDDKVFIDQSHVKDIVSKFNITLGTAYRWKKKFNTNSTESPKSEQKIDEKPFKIVSTNKYSNKVYSKFAAKKLINLSLNDKKLFTKLDSCKLSTTMNIPLQSICSAQAQFLKEIEAKKN